MISFACKEIHIKDLLMCSFELKKTDYTVFMFLMKNEGEFTVEQIAKKLKLERSGVQKAIRNLVSKELIFRGQINLETGGYKFCYSIKDRVEIKSRISSIIDGWHAKVKYEIKNWH